MPGYTEALGQPLFLVSAAALVGAGVWAYFYLRRGRIADERASSRPVAYQPVPIAAHAGVAPLPPVRPAEVNPAVPGVTFADVAGLDEAIEELRELKDYLLDPERFCRPGPISLGGCCWWARPAPARRS